VLLLLSICTLLALSICTLLAVGLWLLWGHHLRADRQAREVLAARLAAQQRSDRRS
jgi:hypothetical protein